MGQQNSKNGPHQVGNEYKIVILLHSEKGNNHVVNQYISPSLL